MTPVGGFPEQGPLPITVIKLNLQRQETWRYSGNLLEQNPERIVIEAWFDRPDTPFHDILLGKGDRFVETYYSHRWYNIFEIRDRTDDKVKGWYCNVSLPAEIEECTISYVDLALDLLVYPNGIQLVLDEDEFFRLDLSPQTRASAQAALAELQELFTIKLERV